MAYTFLVICLSILTMVIVEINYSDVTGKLNQVACTHFFLLHSLGIL